MSKLRFHPFEQTEENYEFIARLNNENFPNQPESASQIRFSDETRDPKYLFERYFGELDGAPVCSCILMEPFWSLRPGKYHINFTLLKAHQGQGLEEEIFDFLMGKLSGLKVSTLTASAREDETDKRRLYDSRGIKMTMRFPVSFLEVKAFDFGPYEGLREKLEGEGIQVATAGELKASDPDFMRHWYNLDWELLQDVPTPEPLTKISFEQFLKWRNSPTFLPGGVLFAMDQGAMVGTSGLWRNDADDKYLVTGLTGVVRSHRRRGIATMLKVEAIKYAQSYGAEHIETDNEENNPMFQLNLQLGFKPAPAWMDFEKDLL